MKYNPDIHQRRSIRLQGYDYSQRGAFFITICSQNRECLFGEVVDGEMRLNDAGRMVNQWYSELECKFPDIQCDEFICMPNHIHFIVVNVGADLRVRPDCPINPDLRVRPDGPVHSDVIMGERLLGHDLGEHAGLGEHQGLGEHIGSPLRTVIQWYKTMTTNAYIRGVKQHCWRSFPGKLWQRNYYEHIVRNESSLQDIREYVRFNPQRWQEDQLHPAMQSL